MTDRVMGDATSVPADPPALLDARRSRISPLSTLRAPAVDISAARRRDVSIPDLEALEREVRAIRDAIQPGAVGLHVTGNWSAGQILHHLSRAIAGALDGFSGAMASRDTPPLPLRQTPILGRVLRRFDRQDADALRSLARRRLLIEAIVPCGPSIAHPEQLAPFAQVWTADAAAWLLAAIARIRDGAPMQHPSPTIGPMTHEQWLAFHLRHAQWHLSFVHEGPGI